MSDARRWRWNPIGVLLALALVAAAAQAAEPPKGPRPSQIIERTAEQILVILNDPERTLEQRRAEIGQIASARFDFRTMTRLVLGRNWKKLTPEQQGEFVQHFAGFLASDYGSRVERYEQQQVSVLGERTEPRGDVTVKTKVTGGEFDGAIIDYRMRYRDEDWRIIDVVIEGISLVANFRDQFREVLSREGPEHLLEKLREKSAAGAQAGAPDALTTPGPRRQPPAASSTPPE
jgi:phospholipid transport system substrate-binding protein